jgi:purine catabolism regulator
VCAILDVEGVVRTGPFDPRGDSEPGVLDAARLRTEVERIRHLGVRGASGFSDPFTSTTLQPLGVGGAPVGYLAVATPGRPDEPGRVATTTALSLLSLIAERRREQRLQERDFRRRSWSLAESGHLEAAGALLGAVGLQIPDSVQVLAVAGDTSEVLERTESRRGFVLAAERDGLVALAFASAAPATVLAALEELGARVGVGPPDVGLGDLAQGWARARSALDVASSARPVVAWEDLSAQGVLALVDPLAGGEFARELLGGLDPGQRETLSCFLDHHGSRVATAQALGVHRNTVRNRIEEIEAQWGRSLDEPATRMDAWAALRLVEGQRSSDDGDRAGGAGAEQLD